MKGVIWSCDSKGDGLEQLKFIQDRYEMAGVPTLGAHYKTHGAWVEFANGDSWRVASACESSRGIRANIALIDARVSEEFVHTVILRTLICPFGPRYYEYYYAKEE